MTDYITAKERLKEKEIPEIIGELLFAITTVAIIGFSIYALTY